MRRQQVQIIACDAVQLNWVDAIANKRQARAAGERSDVRLPGAERAPITWQQQ